MNGMAMYKTFGEEGRRYEGDPVGLERGDMDRARNR